MRQAMLLFLSFHDPRLCNSYKLKFIMPTTIPHSKSLKSPFFPILMLGLNFSKSSSPHLDD